MAFLLTSIGQVATARADDTTRVALLSVPGNAPDAALVQVILAQHLLRVEVEVDIVKRPAMPESDADWLDLARENAAEAPGSLAFFGWRCAAKGGCELTIVQARTGSIARVPVVNSNASDDPDSSNAFALAATAREVVFGGLLLEMDRLTYEGAHPSSPPPTGQRLPEPYGGAVDTGGLARARRPWLWLEGGYHGEYPYPQESTLHGPFLGLALSPGKNIVPVLRTGWLGMAKGDGANGAAKTQCIPFELELRLAFPMGPAMFSIGPLARLDLVVASVDPEGRSASTSTDIDLHLGGMTTWHTPLPGGSIEALVGVGMLATIIGNDAEIDGEEEIPASKLRIVWSAGIAWSPL